MFTTVLTRARTLSLILEKSSPRFYNPFLKHSF